MFWNRGSFGPHAHAHAHAFGGPHHGPHGHHHGHGPRGRGFGLRRPLRFLIERLGLDATQAAEVQRAFEDLRLEREQADLDRRRGQAKLADLLESDTLDDAAVEAAAESRITAAKREKEAVVAALRRIHATLRPEQRPVVASMLRSGPFTL